ncbi:MAG TPA: exodeoxyribonuclease III [Paracoccaceae bacterium]|nr:exodeoxyribonuclease III [Paracoccaceae bacterium]
MKIATFNINGIRARLPALLDWLREATPEIVLLQEIKCTDDAFPRLEIEELSYNIETHGQKGLHGVAILSKRPLMDVQRGLPGAEGDLESRWIEATVEGDRAPVRVCGLYLPNGNPAPGPRYDYKIAWMERMRLRAAELLETEEPVVLAGDYNAIPEPRDVRYPEKWREDALFLPATRAAFRRIVNLGYADAIRECCQDAECYTFWDYQAGAWQKNNGIRIDHVLLDPQAADRLTGAGIDKAVRAREKPSDHVPVWVELDL